ncbi:MAG: MFS transporter [Oscillospiraceae bacterium]|nr:MFS transporter [Oscillospiraceae bacterium]
MKKIKGRGKIILYAASGMGINMLNLMMGSYLCSALLVGGFAAKDVPFQTFAQRDLVVAGVWAVFALIAKIIDGVIDIPMAAFTDGLRTRFGRRRPALLIGLIPLVLAYAAFLIIPDPSGATLVNTVYYGVILCIFYSFYTLTMVNYYATFTEIVETEHERNLLSNAKSVFDIFYFILGYVVVRMLLNGLNITKVALIVLPIALTMLIPLFMIKEPDLRDEAAEKMPRLSLTRSLAYTFRDKPFILWMCVYSFMTMGVQLFLGGINEYFSHVGMSMIFVMVAAFAPVPFTLMLYDRILRKRGFGFAYRYILVTYIVGMMSMFAVSYLPQGTAKTVLSIVAGLVSSLAIGAMFAVAYSLPSQFAAEEEKKKGVSHAAMYFAVQGLFAGVATGIGAGVILTALKGTEGQNSDAIRYLTPICAGAILVSFLLSWMLPKKVLDMGREENK